MYPRLILMDLEGTLLEKALHLDDGRVAPSTWTLIAERLGPCALAEEQATKDRWLSAGYNNYIEWMQDTIEIHRKHGLTCQLFSQVIDSVQEMPGAREAVQSFHQHGAITAIVSGGFKALADRIQASFGIHHALSACEYFFHPTTARLQHWNLLPSDYEGKVHFLEALLSNYNISRDECAFVGDGQNDVAVARAAGLSVAFNAQIELRHCCTTAIQQDFRHQDFRVVAEYFDGLSASC